MEHKTVPFEIKELTDLGVFEGYASVFGNVDAGGDVVERGAFAKTLKERGSKVRVCHQHDWKDVIGKPLELREDDRGLYVKAQLVLDVQRAREDYALMKAGALTDLSIG
ncbi:MAG: HK97 family phage prohead protease, partial [bacterium]